ncbi:MAG: ketopantoate reductase family protein [Caldilineaceae bacterium]|nr:ketopantoate reductase family protein [Caldilineaceae bacterium]
MNILVIGAGAIGCLVGGKLAQHGEKVMLVGRPRFAETVRGQGLTLIDENGRQTIRTIGVAGSIDEGVATGAYDLAIFTVKSYDTQNAVEELVAACDAHRLRVPAVLSLQNGVGNEELLATKLGSAQVIAGTITTPVTTLEPGVIQIDKPRYNVGISAWHPAAPKPLVAATLAALQEAGFAAVNYPSAQGMKWTKLLMNMVGNASSAILDEPPEMVFADPMMIDLEIEAWREALTVMDKAGIPPVNIGSYPFGWLGPLVRRSPNFLLRPILRSQVGGARGGKMPSLHMDLHRDLHKDRQGSQLRSEIEWLNGAVVGRGEQLQVATPVNQMLTEILVGLLDKPVERGLWQNDHIRLAVTADEYRRRAGV